MTEDLSFEVLAATLRQDSHDLNTFVEVLAKRLEASLPANVTVNRQGGLFAKYRPVKSLSITFGDMTYLLERQRGGLELRRSKVVRGIALKTEPMTLDQWIAAVSRELADWAAQHQSAREALERFLLS